jgi:site-specific DNA-methyltransferase (adenine-specific)
VEERAALLWTDPPYGVDYEGKTKAKLRIANDRSDGLDSLLADSFAAVDEVLADGAPLYVAAPGGRLLLAFAEAFLDVGWDLRQTLVWVKDSMVLGRSDYHYRHEQLLYGFKSGPGRLGRGGKHWHGSDSETSVFEVDRPRASREHPTMKPPELIERALLNSSRRRSVVLDPFAGSGSTLVACERTGRRARLVELDPRYCDVVCERWERLTGKRAVVRRG